LLTIRSLGMRACMDQKSDNHYSKNMKAVFKVYVTSTDNGFQWLGMRTLLVGDAILAVDGQPQTTNRRWHIEAHDTGTHKEQMCPGKEQLQYLRVRWKQQ
uniref:Ricin B-type lectin domain-containing protein n=1 Tax=Toxocara canis TaxID=6265 RepID=A0A183TXS6_TOXCA